MSAASFQYLKRPFSRSFGESGEWFEEDSCPAPLKPYFKGSDRVPECHPSKTVRNLIRDELAPASGIPSAFPGNNSKSRLHEHEELFKRLMESIERNEVPLQDGWIQTLENGARKTVHPFSDQVEVLHFEEHDYVIPEKSGFFIGDILDFIRHPIPYRFDVIEMDPPWQSKSTSRAKVYNTRYDTNRTIDRVFCELPLESLCKEGCFILLWVTNDPSCMERAMSSSLLCFTGRDFFARRGITHISTAYWVKTTKGGAPLVPLSCPSRETFRFFLFVIHSFERLIVGRYTSHASPPEKRVKREKSAVKEELLHTVYQLNGPKKGNAPSVSAHLCEDWTVPQIPFLVSSVSFHSRKPDSAEFSFLHLPKEYRGLELFARQLRPNWYSVGDQALLFQSDLVVHHRPVFEEK